MLYKEFSHLKYIYIFFFICLQERSDTLAALAEKANMTQDILNQVPGIKCNPVQGAMYTFPRIHLPLKAILKAKVK